MYRRISVGTSVLPVDILQENTINPLESLTQGLLETNHNTSKDLFNFLYLFENISIEYLLQCDRLTNPM
jgi:hypothetical protein